MRFRGFGLFALVLLCGPLFQANPLSEAEKQVILDLHNSTRAMVASGLLTDDGVNGLYPTASDMTELVWNETLEAVAQGWVDQCNFGHNSDRHAEWLALGGDPQVTWLGENVAIRYTGGSGGVTAASLYDLWEQEHALWHYQPFSLATVNGAGHFTQLIWSRTTEVGCATAFCPSGTLAGRFIACNYAQGGNYLNQYPYQSGPPASACPMDYRPGSGGLCVRGGGGLHPVPDGDSNEGAPMTAALDGTDIEIAWDTETCGAAASYNLYAGSMNDFGRVTQAHCGLGSEGTASVPLSGGAVWWIVTSTDAQAVGSFGQAAHGERGLSDWQAHCAATTQSVAETCP